MQFAMNRLRRVSYLGGLALIAVPLTLRCSVLERSFVLESFWMLADHLHLDRGLHFCFMADFNVD